METSAAVSKGWGEGDGENREISSAAPEGIGLEGEAGDVSISEAAPAVPSLKVRVGPPVSDVAILEALGIWSGVNLGDSEVPADVAYFHAAGPDGQVTPSRYLVRQIRTARRAMPDEEGRAAIEKNWIIQVLSDGALIPANTSFTAPADRFRVVTTSGSCPRVVDGHHAMWLTRYLSEDPTWLYAAVSEEVAGLLHQGESDRIGLANPERPIWQRGRFLFTSPQADIIHYFYNKTHTLSFQVPLAELRGAVEARLLNVNLFIADKGETLDPAARFGTPDTGLEVVAIGSEGISWLLDHLADDAL